ncbi:hypothetical protein BRADI_1g19698v3, partial [Brachypodium distachyon]
PSNLSTVRPSPPRFGSTDPAPPPRLACGLPPVAVASPASPDPPPQRSALGRVASMYIRVKRHKSTYFIQCDPTETILNIKQKLESIIDHPPNNQRLILLATNNVLNDSKTLADQKVENDTIVALTLRKDNNEFEEVSIANPDDFMSSS